jgi:hypothetical protein
VVVTDRGRPVASLVPYEPIPKGAPFSARSLLPEFAALSRSSGDATSIISEDLAKCYLDEDGSAEVRALARNRDHIACSEYGRMELHAVLHRNLREGWIPRTQLDVLFRQLDLDEKERLWTWLPLTERVMAEVASAFRVLPESVFLRTGDAIHLATARMNAFTEIWSGDLRLLSAAPHFGLVGRRVDADPTRQGGNAR